MASIKAEKPAEKAPGPVKKEPASKSSGSKASKPAPKKTEQKSQPKRKVCIMHLN